MKKRKMYFKGMLKILVLIMILVTVANFFKIQLVKKGGVYVGNPIFNSYAYTIYFDHAVLEQFKGEEQEEIVIPTTILGRPVTTIGWKCFERHEEIEKVVLHDNIEVIEGFAFRGCDNLTEVVNGSNVKRIDTQAFKVCRKLEIVEIGRQLEVIGLGAFDMCEALKELPTQEELVLIDDYAFTESGLQEFVFNNDVRVGSSAFRDTPWLSNQEEEFIIYGEGQLIWNNGSDDRVNIPEGVITLLWGCFDGTDATDIYLPTTVVKIEEFAFSNCENVKVYIPESVVEMGGDRGQLIVDYNDAITIITTKDSYAHQYAIDHDIPYEIVESW